jgi:hypothetical protein
MPTNRTRRTRGRTGAITGRQIEHLIYGWCLAVVDPQEYGHESIHYPFCDDAHRRACWLENREMILSYAGKGRIPGVFGAEPLKKGQKPAAMKDYENRKDDRNER